MLLILRCRSLDVYKRQVQAAESQKLTLSFVSGQTMTFSYKGDTQYAVGDDVKVYGQLLSANDDKTYEARAFFIVK